MAIPSPKILTCYTVPSGGYSVDIEYGSGFGTSATITVPAGDYYLSGDDQDDDLYAVFGQLLETQIRTVYASARVYFQPDYDATIKKSLIYAIFFTSGNLRIDWTTGTELADVFGFDNTTQTTWTAVVGAVLYGDYQHGYGWYADEDGQLRDDTVEPIDIPNSPQSISPSGYVKTQHIASRFTYSMQLQFLKRDLTYSRGVSYGEESKYPYSRNKGLECWFREAKKGTRFRVYRQGRFSNDSADYSATATSSTSSTITASAASFPTDPQRFKGAFVYRKTFLGGTSTARYDSFFIESHTDTVLTVANHHREATDIGTNLFYIIDGTYETYVLDLSATPQFAPLELPNIDRYDFAISMLRYES